MSTVQQETLSINGMSCDHCVRAVRDALGKIDAVTPETVEIGSATVSYDAGVVSRETIVRSVEEAGYTVVE